MKVMVSILTCAVLSIPAMAQVPNESSQTTQSAQPGPAATFHVTVVSRNISAVNYRHRGGATNVDFRGTDLMPQAKGEAKVDSKTGRTSVEAKFENLGSANKFGMEYLTYVLWAITPEGRAKNLGEVVPKDGKADLHVTTELQAFGMIVTAEPHFAVTQPSDVVILENAVLSGTKGIEEPITARYELLPRGLYSASNEPMQDIVYGVDKKAPLDLLEARNAVRIARAAKAPQYASSSFDKAQTLLRQAETYYQQKQGKTPIATVAREAAQTAEEARVMAINREQQETAENQRRALAEREAQAKAQAEAEAARRAQAEQERIQAEQARRDAESAAQRAAQEREQADAARSAALAQQQAAQAQAEQARLTAQQAEQARLQAEQEREQIRARLMQQLNDVLQTRDTARGLIVNMSDVLFDTGKATLKPGARERLARVAGIVQAYPDLQLQIEGHTDNVGGDAYNQMLSERRADAVRAYLISQGVPERNIVARGLGKAEPVASNTTAAGRQLNRRVDLVVSGEAIGSRMAPPLPASQPGVNSGGVAGSVAAPPAVAQPNAVPQGGTTVGNPVTAPSPQNVPQAPRR